MKFVPGLNSVRSPEGETRSILFAGDVCPRSMEEAIINGKSKDIFAEVLPFFQSADCRILQWETTLGDFDTPILKAGPNLKVDARCIDIAKTLHADIALMANNHTADFGPDSALKTRDVLHAAGLKTVGAGCNLDDAVKPLYFTCGKISVALLNYAEHEFGFAEENKAGTSPQRVIPMLNAVREEAAKGYKVIVALHGGHEYNPYPSPRMVQLFRGLIDAGASLVWNCHTHCPEGIEFYKGCPIVYCPGNFYFPAISPSRRGGWFAGYVAKFHFDAKGVYGIELLPYQQDNDKVTVLTEDRELAFYDYLNTLCAPLSDPEQLQELFKIWCTIGGPGYLSSFGDLEKLGTWEPAWDTVAVIKAVRAIRGIMTCESHNDMIRQFSLMIFGGEVESYKAKQSEVKQLQNPDFIRL